MSLFKSQAWCLARLSTSKSVDYALGGYVGSLEQGAERG
jgi:hypothetical protein